MRAVPSTVDRLLRPLHRRVWADANRRARKLLRFAETEAAGGRDLSRAAERTRDPLLRRLFLRHALEEQRHADLFREPGPQLLKHAAGDGGRFEANWLAPGERGLEEVQVEADGRRGAAGLPAPVGEGGGRGFAEYGRCWAAIRRHARGVRAGAAR